jgi:acetyl esterase/lipase
MCNDPEIDLVYVAVPHGLHYEYAVKAIEAGKAVLAEKAFTLTQAQAIDLAERAAAKGVFIMEAMWTRFLPLYQKLQAEFAAGNLGEVTVATAFFGFPLSIDESHRLIDKKLGGGSLLDQGVYTVTFADIFYGGVVPERISARGSLLPNGVDGLTLVDLDYGNGRFASANSALSTGLGTEAFLATTTCNIHVKGSFWNSDEADIITVGQTGDPVVRKIIGGKRGAGYSHMIEAVSADVLAGKTQSEVHPIANTIRTQDSKAPPAWLPPTFGPIPPAETTASGLKRLTVRYALISGYRPLELDLYLPTAVSAGRPVATVIWVHGGGYAGGSRRDFTPWLERAGFIQQVLDAGMAFASIDYRLGLEATFPAAIHDGNSALRWLAQHASKLGLDPSRFALWGESAGGHLASLVALTQGDSFFEGDNGVPRGVGYRVRALCDWYGAADLITIIRPMDGTDESIPEQFRFPPEYFNLGAARWREAELRRQASPASYVSAAMPPTLRIHGTADQMVPFSQSVEFYEAALLAGGSCQLVEVEGGDHAWFGLAQERVTEVVSQSVEFLKSHLG